MTKKINIVKVSELEFDKNVFFADHLQYDESDSLRRINGENDLDFVKASLIEKLGDVPVIIDRDKNWYDVFKIHALDEAARDYISRKGKDLIKWKTTE